MEEGGQTARQHVPLASTPPGGPSGHTLLGDSAVRDEIRGSLVEDGDVSHGVGEVLHYPGVGGDTGRHVSLQHSLHQPRELHGVGSDDGSGVA